MTARELAMALFQVPADMIIEIARDNDINGTGPIALEEDGSVSLLMTKFRDSGKTVGILWPLYTETTEDRYADED
ncbi:MAG: hypothetical protein QNJ44_05180 [Rhodobacter sp.]|nr:hypothetical protein [Rhodobacter sp.]